jgi:hypothetical protein
LGRRLAEIRALPAADPIARKKPRAAQSWVWPAIRRVLAEADGPMQPIAIYAAVVEDLDTRVSKSTIKNELRRRLGIKPVELRQDEGGYSLLGRSGFSREDAKVDANGLWPPGS